MFRREDAGQRRVLDLHRLARGARLLERLGRDECDRLALMPNTPFRQHVERRA